MREGIRLYAKTVLVLLLGSLALAHSNSDQADLKTARLFGLGSGHAARKSDHQKLTERANRILATTYPTIEIQNFRRDQTLVFKNLFSFNDQTNLTAQFSLRSDSDPQADSPSKVLAKPKAAFWGNHKDYIVLQMDDKTQLDNEYLFLSVGTSASPAVYRSTEKIYQYYDSGAEGMMQVSLALAIVFMLFACCCWCGGMRQFYLLIRIPQMIFMLTLLGSKPHPANYFSLLENFRYNLFSVIPNPVAIDERNSVECQLPIQFFAEMLSCHAYNSLKNYVLAFLIFSILYAFFATNKFHDRQFFARIRSTMDFHMFMLSIFPDVAIAIYLNAVAGLTNSVLSIGFFLSLLLVVWYVHIFNTVISYYYHHNKQYILVFLRFFIFSRNRLTDSEPKLGVKLLAVLLDYLKIFIVVTMIALFYNAPKTQMVIVFLVYLFNAIFLIVVRPYTNIFQNVFFAISDFAFFLIVVLAFAHHETFDTTTVNTKESKYGGAQVALVFIIFFVNHFNFVIPMLKGHDNQAIIHKTEEGNQESSANDINSKTSAILKREADTDKPHHVDQKEATSTVTYLGRPSPPEREIRTSEGKSNSRITEGSELPLNKEEQVPMKPKESENPALQTGKKKIEIKGMHPGSHKEFKPSEENLLRSEHLNGHDNVPPTTEHRDQPGTAQHSQHQPMKNNLLISSPVEPTNAQPMSQVQSLAQLDPSPPNEAQQGQSARNSNLPPVKTGKVPVRKTFKPAEVKNQDFEGM